MFFFKKRNKNGVYCALCASILHPIIWSLSPKKKTISRHTLLKLKKAFSVNWQIGNHLFLSCSRMKILNQSQQFSSWRNHPAKFVEFGDLIEIRNLLENRLMSSKKTKFSLGTHCILLRSFFLLRRSERTKHEAPGHQKYKGLHSNFWKLVKSSQEGAGALE